MFVVVVVVLVAFIGGFIYADEMHGDWLLVRQGTQCAAFDPTDAKIIGQWTPSIDGRCHMKKFLQHQLWFKVLGNTYE
jgi:hypothetical protein